MSWTISYQGSNVTIFADEAGLDQIIELATLAKKESVSKVIDPENDVTVTFVLDREWTPR